jgi:two-component system, NtrC family, response regulator GlrR
MVRGPDTTTEDDRPVGDPKDHSPTLANHDTRPVEPLVRRFRLSAIEGPGKGISRESTADRLTVGSHALNDLVIDDPTVSRFHCEIRVEDGAAVVTDLRSKNATIVDGVEVREAVLRSGCLLRLGRATVRFEYAPEHNRPALSALTRFGSLAGTSAAMRQTIALLERASASDATVLLEGETGTGKGKAAEAIHQASPRRDKSFVVVDCGAIPAPLLESELFGHEKGAFTGADSRRIGAFEDASGGTLFLDEIGELPSDLQPKLLRALENRELRRIGSNKFIAIDLRVIAATNRDLRAEVNAGRFRSDLYFRLAVVKIPLPSIRQRPDDIPVIVEELLRQLDVPEKTGQRLLTPSFLAELQRMSWPGNVREFRNHLERVLVFADDVSLPRPIDGPGGGPSAPIVPFAEARKRAQDSWERQYLEGLMRQFPGKVAEAAKAAGVDRVYLYRLLRRQGMKP